MRVGVVTFPGTLDDFDAARAVRFAGGESVSLWHGDEDLAKVDAVILPGGFSYGDYLRCGAIARFAPMMSSIIEGAKNGLPVLGICNGFQILCESGLLPGALLHNDSRKFICKNVFIKAENNTTILTNSVPVKALKIPIAHGEGKYFADTETLDKMKANGQIIFKYCNDNGEITADSNPNGATENIAGVCNAGKNVFGMMPHPERAADELLGNIDGKFLFESILKGILVNA